jgi:hypothetical protein
LVAGVTPAHDESFPEDRKPALAATLSRKGSGLLVSVLCEDTKSGNRLRLHIGSKEAKLFFLKPY